jgi:tetratricopeptide (TPR) repeat protein
VIDVSDGKLLWSLPPVSGPVASPTTGLEKLTRRIVALVAQTSDTTSVALSTLSSPPSLDAYTEFRKGLEAIFTGSDAAAYSHLFRATSLDTTYVTAWVLLAAAAENGGDKSVMDSALKRASRLTERMTPVERALVEYTESKSHGDLDGTLKAAQTLFQLTPGSSESPLLLATAALAGRRPHTALAALRDVDPDRGLNLAAPFYWKNRTVALYQLGDYRGALDACERGQKRFPKDYFLAHFCVSALLHLGKVDRVVDLVANEELGPARGDLAAHAALMMEELGSTAASRRLATKWLGELPSGAKFRHSRALLLMAAGSWADARAILARLAEADSGSGPASRERRIPIRLRVLGTLGIVNARLQLPAEALRIDSVLKATAAEGGEVEILRARIHAQLGDLEEAEALAEEGRDKGWELLSLMNSLADDHWLVPLRRLPSFRSIVALKD